MATVMYVDDEATIRRAVHYWLARRGFDIHTSRSIAGAKRCVKIFAFDGIFIDFWLGDGCGLDLYAWLQTHHPQLAEQTVFVTGDLLMRPELHERLVATGRPVLEKPFDLSDLDTFIQKWKIRAPRPQGDNGLTNAASNAQPTA
jgi:DNA-binding NtrC family response regulator